MTRALVEAGMALGSALSLAHVLQILVDVARELVAARYAALGVINADRTGLSDFVTSGMSAEVRARIGALPKGEGILGLLIRDARPLRLRDLREHPASAGVPARHPRMRSFMGVPITAQGRVFGNLYVTEKIGAEEFSEADLALLEVLATQAAVAIENARLRATRDRLVAAVSHALGNALAGVRLWTSALVQTPPASQNEWLDGIKRITSAAAQSTRLVEGLVALTEIQEGSLELHATTVDVAELVRRSVVELKSEADAAGVTLEARPDGALPVELDAARTRQIVVNVLAHAIAMSPEQTRVTVESSRRPDGSVDVRVRDGGPPVTAKEAELLFEPSLSAAVHTSGRRFGFELPVSRQLARLMGGELTAEGMRGDGVLFTLRLPPIMRER
jgi:signal transduction histidine kinase